MSCAITQVLLSFPQNDAAPCPRRSSRTRARARLSIPNSQLKSNPRSSGSARRSPMQPRPNGIRSHRSDKCFPCLVLCRLGNAKCQRFGLAKLQLGGNMRFKRLGAFMLAAVTIFGGLIASGGDEASSASTAPVVVGIVCTCTGALASSTEVGPPAYVAWADYQNAHGGLNGHPIKVLVKDDSSNPATALAEVTTMVTKNHIAVLVDDSQVDSAFAKYIDSQHVPVIGGGSQSDILLTDPNFFAPGQTVDDYFINYMEAAKKVGVSNIAQLYCAESPICQNGVAPFKATAKAEGITVGYVSSISFSAPSYTAECLAAKQGGVQIMNVADAVTVVEHVASDCSEAGLYPLAARPRRRCLAIVHDLAGDRKQVHRLRTRHPLLLDDRSREDHERRLQEVRERPDPEEPEL